MKFRIIALILALSVLSWTQTSTQPPTSTTPSQNAPAADKKAACPCCEKTASAGDNKAACCEHMKDGKCDMASCQGKDGMSCMKGDKEKGVAGCGDKTCAEHGCCSHDHEHDKAAMSCCGEQCDRKSHSHAGAAK
jgi:hypothetical protein